MTVLAIAHRAGNDLEALRAATELGADVLETDVHRYRGRLEVRHSKALGPLPYLYESGEPLTSTRVPQLLLPEVLATCSPGTTLMLDLKGPGKVGRHVAELVHRWAPDVPVLVCSRWWPGVDAFADRPWARPVLTARTPPELLRLRRRVRGPRAPYGVSLHPSLVDRRVVAELHERVALVMTWQVNSPAALEHALHCGINGVISDSHDVLASVLALRSDGRSDGAA